MLLRYTSNEDTFKFELNEVMAAAMVTIGVSELPVSMLFSGRRYKVNSRRSEIVGDLSGKCDVRT